MTSPQDHPRSRGVYGNRVRQTRFGRGSSPLARGLRKRPTDLGAAAGIIPARAGFTRPSPWEAPKNPDHPRSRGVYPSLSIRVFEERGSSPLARGLRIGPRRQAARERIIPARAGFTYFHHHGAREREDHPRSRGVYCADGTRTPESSGSSPLARGLRSPAALVAPAGGIIPARAGFTSTTPTPIWRTTDHPRSRGVYHHTPKTASFRHGSSPLARGLLGVHGACGVVGGIIPARAGFTLPLWATPYESADHPRSRGVYCAQA